MYETLTKALSSDDKSVIEGVIRQADANVAAQAEAQEVLEGQTS